MNKKKLFKDILLIVVILTIALLLYHTFPTKVASTQAPADTNLSNTSLNQMEQPQQNAQLQIKILNEGAGTEAQNGQTIQVHYTGKLTNGTVFDSSIPRGTPFSLKLGAGQVIPGWELGLLGMKVGEKRELTIPSQLAYGKDGFPGVIPPNATLIFEVELLAIE